MSQTCNHASTCEEYLSPKLRRRASIEDYWISPEGITRRIRSLSQIFNWKLVNNACKVIAPVNRAKWLQWVDYGDLKVCPICLHHSTKGGNGKGFWKVQWFMPEMPVHPGCRCQWVIWFIEPVKQIKLIMANIPLTLPKYLGRVFT